MVGSARARNCSWMLVHVGPVKAMDGARRRHGRRRGRAMAEAMKLHCIIPPHHAWFIVECTCRRPQSRLGLALARDAALPPPSPCPKHGEAQDDDFDALQTRLERQGQTELGPWLHGVPARWFVLPAKVRCVNDHVVATSDPHDFIAGHCRTCGAPVALTFPEDSSGPLRA